MTGKKRSLVLVFLGFVVVLMVFIGSETALADHSVGNACYTCHSLKSTAVYAETYAINNTKAVQNSFLSGGAAVEPLWCDYCHSNYTPIFFEAKSAHPVPTIGNEAFDAGTGKQIICDDCHGGGAPEDLLPDSRDLAGRENETDGYPDHLNTDGNYTNFESGHFTYSYNSTSFALCYDCHGSADDGGDASEVNSTIDIQTGYEGTKKGSGHNYTGAGSKLAGWKLPCYNCHYAHSSAQRVVVSPFNGLNDALIIDQTDNYWPNSTSLWGTLSIGTAFSYDELVTDASGDIVDRDLCLRCHNAADPPNETVEGVEPPAPSSGIHQSFISDADRQCLNSNSGCHSSPHEVTGDSDAACMTCHGGGPTGSEVHPGFDGVSGGGDDAPNVITYWFGLDGTKQDGGHGDDDGKAAIVCTECHDVSLPPGTHLDGTVNSTESQINMNSNTAHLKAAFISSNSTPAYDVQITFDITCGGTDRGVSDTSCHKVNNVPIHRHSKDSNPALYAVEFGQKLSTPDGESIPYPIDSDITTNALIANPDYAPCVACHNPHGTGCTDIDGTSSNHMIRDKWRTDTILCDNCH